MSVPAPAQTEAGWDIQAAHEMVEEEEAGHILGSWTGRGNIVPVTEDTVLEAVGDTQPVHCVALVDIHVVHTEVEERIRAGDDRLLLDV